MGSALRKFVVLAVPASILSAVFAVTVVEVAVRARWDHTRGTPGFYLSDPVLGQRLAPGYNGWFAGVPVKINSLGFRDPRDYAIEKADRTFRILVLGDSVTFGHGALYETTYPYLLEQRLKTWRPDIGWQVWNLGVPGYNTATELAYLTDVGGRFQPDLVIVGFYPNDFTENEIAGGPSWWRRAGSAALRLIQSRLYSYELYKRVYLTARWRLLAAESDRKRLEHLASESALLNPQEAAAEGANQQLTPVDYFDDAQVRHFTCIGAPRVDPDSPGELYARIHARVPEIAPWLDAVRELQRLAREGAYRVMFFVNMAPEPCHGQDRFYNGGSLADDEALLDVLSDGTPVVSSARAFLHYRPSQMPFAGGHSVGNSNRVKADVLFDYLSVRVLPPLLPRVPSRPQ